MGRILEILLGLWCIHIAAFTDPGCIIELECPECMPDNMPMVTSHGAASGAVRAAAGDEVTLSCGGGAFLAYPGRGALAAVCEAGRYRVRHDGALRHLLELGCQENVFEDVLHEVEYCSPPLQGRAYQMQEAGSRGVRHLATLCFDADRGAAAWARATSAPHNALALHAHDERSAPLSLLGNFNHMFDARTRADAERLYSNPERMTRRLAEYLRPDKVTLAGQTLGAAPLLAPGYFEEQNARAAGAMSNLVPTWRGIAEGNLRHLQRDVAALLRAARPRVLQVLAGTHGVLSLRAGPAGKRREAYLQPGRFPVPRYIWTVVLDPSSSRALAVVLLNDPLVAVSEIREAVFCESACGAVSWLRELRRHRNYEVPAFGLVFCCALPDFAAVVPGLPRDVFAAVPPGPAGMLMEQPRP